MVKAIVGANWGDEGKGKITDMLAQDSDIIIRFQGGANAGHTIINDYGKFALHTLPSGIFYGHTTSIIGNGVALNIPILFNELKEITSKGVPAPKILMNMKRSVWQVNLLVLLSLVSHLSILISMRRLVSRLTNYSKKRQYFEKRLSVLSYRKISY